MNSPKTIQIGNIQAKFLHNDGRVAIVFLPGVSGGIFDNKYDYLVPLCELENCSLLMPEIWKDSVDLNEMTLQEIYSRLDEVLSFLRKSGIKEIIGIGKSFGASVLFTSKINLFDLLILLAPPLVLGETDNIIKISKDKIRDVELTDLVVSRESLKNITNRTVFIHGADDNVVPLETIKDLSSSMINAEMIIIEGADHSFTGAIQKNILIDIMTKIVHSFNRKD